MSSSHRGSQRTRLSRPIVSLETPRTRALARCARKDQGCGLQHGACPAALPLPFQPGSCIPSAGVQISFYTHWGLINPSRDVFDTDGFRAIQPFIDLCKQVGLWVIFRPGPYINAEVGALGLR